MIKELFLSIIIITLGLCQKSAAQVNDAGLWVHVAIEKKISSYLDLQVSQEFRFYENFSELGTAFTEAQIQYKIFRSLDVAAEYRFIQSKRLNDSYIFQHRLAFSITYEYDISRLSISLRGKYQTRYSQVNSSENGFLPNNTFRTRLQFTYDVLKKYSPFASGEIYYSTNNPEGNEIRKVRYNAGLNYEINKHHSFSISYLIDKEVNQNNPWTDYVIDTGYKFTF